METPVVSAPAPEELPSDLITTDEAAAIVRTCRATVVRWIISGKLTGYRLGGHKWRISKRDLLNMIQVFRTSDANDKKIEAERTRPATKGELAKREKETDEYLRKAGIRK